MEFQKKPLIYAIMIRYFSFISHGSLWLQKFYNLTRSANDLLYGIMES